LAEPRAISIPAGYPGVLAGFIGFFSLTLLALLDVRRGVLFADYPVRTFFHVFTPCFPVAEYRLPGRSHRAVSRLTGWAPSA
jgi:hypothetical protein